MSMPPKPGVNPASAYLAVVGNTLTFAIPDEEVGSFVKELPEYEYTQRTVNLSRAATRKKPHSRCPAGGRLGYGQRDPQNLFGKEMGRQAEKATSRPLYCH